MRQFRLIPTFVVCAIVLAPTVPAFAAAPYTYLKNTPLQIQSIGVTLTVMAGSQRDDIVVANDHFTVTLGEGEAFAVRFPGPTPGALENDGGELACNVLPDLENQLLLTGPKIVTVIPSQTPCTTKDSGSNTTPMISFVAPNGGETLAAGTNEQIFWSGSGTGVAKARLSLSTDGGATFSPLVSLDQNSGFYDWTVPDATTDGTLLRIEGLTGEGRIVAFDITDGKFSIKGTAPATPSAPPTLNYDPAAVTAAATSIDVNQELPAASSTICVPGVLIKGASNAAVYYCSRDGKRHAFPNEKIFHSWYDSFSGVVTVSDATLASISLGKSVTYRPGVRMVKVQTDPKVYAVAANGTLRWVQNEDDAAALYGADWNTKIDDLSDAFFADYTVGDPVSAE